jgi:glycerol-3-phosphate acyltransferase PlsY
MITMDIGWSIAIALGYLSGSIPVGYLIGKSKGVDLRTVGSGNIGATNCGRVLGRKWGLTCFFLDVLKGTGPVVGTGWAMGLMRSDLEPSGAWMWLAVAVAAMLGHIFPVWLGFKGGKGVATGLGVVLGVYPFLTLPAVGAALTWILFAGTFRYVSLASIVAALTLPCWFGMMAGMRGWSWGLATPFLCVTVAMALLVIVRHRSNIGRLMRGTESRLGSSGKKT